MNKQELWDETFMEMTLLVAKRHSKDPKQKVGALIAKDCYPLSFGYNGIIRGMSNDYLYSEDKLVYAEHAERNAIFNAVRNHIDVRSSTLYTTHHPCHECMRAIIQSSLGRVVIMRNPEFESGKWRESISHAVHMAREVGLVLTHMEI